MLSEEAAKDDEQRRKSASEDSNSDTVTEQSIASPLRPEQSDDEDDIAKAIRLSLQECHGIRTPGETSDDMGTSSFTIKYATNRRSPPSKSPPISGKAISLSSPSGTRHAADTEMAEFELALQMSQAEEASRSENASSGKGRNKGKGRADAV